LRHTPAGIPAIDILIGHNSIQNEAGVPRKVHCQLSATALGDAALQLARLKLSSRVRFRGFLAQNKIAEAKLILHVTKVELIDTE
jgi:primosomal replication protein N